MPHKTRTILGALTACLIAVAVVVAIRLPPSSDAERLIVDVERGELRLDVTGLGTVEPSEVRVITAIAPGTVKSVGVVDGATVKAGDVLIELENRLLARELSNAQSALAKARQALAQANAKSEAGRLTSEAAQLKAQGELSIAKLQHEAEQRLQERGMGGSIALQRARIELERATTEVKVAMANATADAATNRQAVLSAEADVAAAERDLASAEERVSGLIVRASGDGFLAGALPRPGDVIVEGQKLAEILSTEIAVRIALSQADAEHVTPGLPAHISRDGKVLTTTVASIAARNVDGIVYAISAPIDEAVPPWRADTRVEVRIHAGSMADAITIPRLPDAVPHSAGAVYKVDQSGKSARRTGVVFGIAVGDRIVVTQGLEDADRIAVVADTREEIEL